MAGPLLRSHGVAASMYGRPRFAARQNGAAMLLLLLALLLGSSYMLLTRLNGYTRNNVRETRTQLTLNEAKQALLGYAMNYPELRSSASKGPGFLPCPDTDDDGLPDNCGYTVTTTAREGRLPFRILGLKDLRESGGERLWYAVSDNFKNTLSNSSVINSETPGLISADGSGDIVAVILAPGAPVAAQTARPSNNAADYLEDVNAAGGGTFTSSAGGEFNDRLVTITRQELMNTVEKRVASEVRHVLANYRNVSGGAYPWLTPFADPAASFNGLRGSHTGADNASSLTDSSVDFSQWGVQTGDVVRNITDGSVATVTAVAANTLTLGTISLGTDNDFDKDDEYLVYIKALGSRLRSTATAGSSGLTLVDTARDFTELGVTPGDIIDKFNGSNMSSGVVQTVSANQITVESLTGTATNAFASGESYAIRSNWGVATSGSGGLLLTDTRKNFTTMGVKAGDLIVNAGDGSYGRVSAVTANTLTVSELIMGAVNVFNAGDNYFLPRYNTDGASREGLLSFHERGQPFKTGFDVDWSLLESNGIVIQTVPDVTGGAQTGYLTKVKADIQSSASTYSVGVNDGTCVWMDENYIECNGKTDIADMSVGGVVTSGFNTSTVTDSSQSFITGGVKRGDLIQNFNDETDLSMSRNVDSGSCGTARTGSNNLTLKDTMNNFLDIGVAAGDTVTNKTDGSSGTIQTVAANQLTVVSLSGGTSNVFTTGDSYEISGGPRLYDNGANLLNYIQDGPYELMVRNNTTGLQGVVTEIVDNNTLVAASYPNSAAICFSKGDSYKIRVPQYMAVNTVSSATSLTTAQLSSPAPDFDTGEYYRIKSAAKKFPAGDGIYDDVDGINFSGTRFTEFGDDLVALGVEKGDVVRNITNNNAYGKITDIYVSGGNTYVTATLYGGYWWRNSFATNDLYEIYYNYVDSRELQFRVRFNGGTASPLGRNVYAVAGIRKRSDCIGYGSDCSAAAGAGSVPYNFGIPVITLTDYEDDLDVAATTTSTIPNAGSPTGNIRVSNIDYYLAEGGNELPEWFVHNKWYQFVYAAYSSGFRPGAAGSCTAGGNCLSVSLPYPVPAGTIYNDRHSVVLTAGRELASQNRAAAAIADYFEGQNASASDDSFVKGEISSSFNDQISVVCPDPLNTDCP